MIKTAMVGLGKMGLSHLSILRAHPGLDLVAGCDATTYLTDILGRHAGLKCYGDFDRMLDAEQLDALVVATPSKLHAPMVRKALERGLDVFCEKPFVLDVAEASSSSTWPSASRASPRSATTIASSARSRRRRGSSSRAPSAKSITSAPRPTARSSCAGRARRGARPKNEGGGALYDYGVPRDRPRQLHLRDAVGGERRRSATRLLARRRRPKSTARCHFDNGASGQLSVNWSDESFRKMSTRSASGEPTVASPPTGRSVQLYLR
jgi:hypothetical protein